MKWTIDLERASPATITKVAKAEHSRRIKERRPGFVLSDPTSMTSQLQPRSQRTCPRPTCPRALLDGRSEASKARLAEREEREELARMAALAALDEHDAERGLMHRAAALLAQIEDCPQGNLNSNVEIEYDDLRRLMLGLPAPARSSLWAAHCSVHSIAIDHRL